MDLFGFRTIAHLWAEPECLTMSTPVPHTKPNMNKISNIKPSVKKIQKPSSIVKESLQRMQSMQIR